MAPSKRVGIAAAIAAFGVVCFAVVVWFEAQGSLKQAGVLSSESSIVPVSVQPLAGSPPLFHPIPAQPDYRSAALFEGDLWLAGAGGLYRLGIETGELLGRWRPGTELPAAPLTALAVGRIGGASETRLLAATAGEGLLSISAEGSIVQIRPEDQALADLTAILPLSTGGVLLGSQRAGLLAWDGQQMRRYHELLSDQEVTALAGNEGDLWIGTLNDGLHHWAGGALTHFAEQDGLSDRQVLSLAYTPERLFAGGPLGVAAFRNGRFDRSLGDGAFAVALRARPDALTIGTLDEGVFELPLADRRTPRPPGPRAQAPGPDEVRAFVSRGGDTFLVAREAVYIQASDDSGWRLFSGENAAGLRDENISALHIDSTNRLWVGYFDRGLDVLDRSHERLAQLEDDRIFCINRIKSTPDGQAVAVATANGLAYFDRSARLQQFLTRDDGLISSHVTDIAFTPSATVAATPAGLTFLDAGGAHSLYAFHGLVNNHVYSLGAVDNQVLAGTLGGLSELNSGQVGDSFTTANSPLSHNWVSAISSFGGDWFIGLYGGGVVRRSANGEWTSYPELGGVEINPNAMVSSDSRLYAGSLDRGLLVYEPSEDFWRLITEGLPSKNVTALAWADGTLYIGSDNGLSRANESEIAAR